MDAIDANTRVQQSTSAIPPSLLFLILDTSPLAWAALMPHLPLQTALANLLVFINAHLAFSQDNRVAVLAAHCGATHWLYPAPSKPHHHGATKPPPSSNKYRPFALVESTVLARLNALLAATKPTELERDVPTPIAGALTLALTYINRQRLSLTPAGAQSYNTSTTSASTSNPTESSAQQSSALASRILLVSTSASDLATQYIPLTNAMFAAQHAGIPIDVLKLAGDTALLQQAAFTTGGVFIAPEGLDSERLDSSSSNKSQQAKIQLLPYLLRAFLPDTTARAHLLPPTSPRVDFRAACFCHRRVVSTGFVCSICLSIFCGAEEVLGAEMRCLTCGTVLVLGGGGGGEEGGEGEGKRKEKKKKRRREGEGGGGSVAAAAATSAA